MFSRDDYPVGEQEPVHKLLRVVDQAAEPDPVSVISELVKAASTDAILAAIHACPQLSEVDRATIILAAVAVDNHDCLRAFVRPQTKGGLGWSLDVKNDKGETPLSVAAKHKQITLLKELLLPVEAQGFGLSFDKNSLRMTYSKYGMFPYSDMRYRRRKSSKADRQNSFIEFQGQRFVRKDELGAGAFSVVSRFTSESDASQHLAVKQPLENRKKPSTPLEVLYSAGYPHKEISFFNLLYPHLNPCRLQHYIDVEKQIHDFREVMPVIKGLTCDELIKTIHTPIDLMNLILAIAIEVERIHSMGVVHGDLKGDNMMIDAITKEQGEIDKFVVTCLDFEYGGYIGKLVNPFLTKSDHVAPDRQQSVNPRPVAATAQDVYSLAYLIHELLQDFKDRVDDKTRAELYEYASVMAFAHHGYQDDPEKRPLLSTFITLLNEDIEAVQKTLDSSFTPRMK